MSRETFEFRIYCDGSVYFEDDYHEIPEDAPDDYRTTRVEVDDDDNIYGDMSSLLSIKNAGFEYKFPSASYKPPLGEVFDLSPEDELALPDIQRGMCIAFEYIDLYLDACLRLNDYEYSDEFLTDFHSRRDKLRVDHFPLSAKETVGLFTFFLRNCPQIEMIKHLPSTELYEMASGKEENV